MLSTITRNAHIQPVNRNKRKYRHIAIQFQFDISALIVELFHFLNSDLSSFFSPLSLIRVNIWKIIAIQKIRTKAALRLFIEIAILSEDKPNHQLVQPVKENINVKN